MKIPQSEYDFLTNKIKENEDKIKARYEEIKQQGEFNKSPEYRLAWDVIYSVYRASVICDLFYSEYGVDDTHIGRFGLHCLKNANII